ncbi:hypothetical protein OEZ86_013355 [Tetradesmus obliquus]|nr:hypothetical protein OEZ86_013355 [Tetradesmus obliquus]
MGLGMRRAVGTTVAAQFQHDNTEVIASVNFQRNSKQKGDDGEDGVPVQPRLIVRAIHAKWQAQLEKWADYRSLFGLIAFITVFLGVLYAQRGATIAYSVHSTIASVVLPGSDTLQSTDDVYSWLQNLLQNVWKDPNCGDGICEAPFEFAAFSRFGCKADCGRLSDIQNLTSGQVDIYWDFSHQASSLPASELMQQASWNLCPQDIQYNADCYDDPDNKFASISGSLTKYMPDLPDGDWSLVLKKDIFQKTRGAVRDTVKLSQAAFWFKVYVAAAAAAAEQARELQLLNTALGFMNRSMIDALPAVWAEADVNQAYRDAFDAQQMLNASCLCSNVTSLLTGTIGFTDSAAYLASKCTGVTSMGLRTYDADGNATITFTSTPSVQDCADATANLTAHRASYNATLIKYLVVQRLGNLRDTGKYGVRYSVLDTQRSFLSKKYPELVSGIFVEPKGADAHVAAAATVSALANLYVESDLYLVAGAPAHLALYRRRLNQDPNLTFGDWATRTNARINEIKQQQDSVAAVSISGPDGITATVGQVVAAFQAAGATTAWLPAAPAVGPPLSVADYNLATWDGNTTAYLSCNLDIRGPEYLGMCTDMPVTCASQTNDTAPYSCARVGDNSTVPGTIRNSTYREQCELPCDMQLDCNALCECWDSCGSSQYCLCSACKDLHPDAAADTQFFTIKDAAASSGAASANIAATTSGTAGRRLLQTADNVTQQLSAVLAKVDVLRSAQDSISGQMSALQSQVDKANLLAEARAASTTLQDFIAAGRSDIQTGQAVLVSKLDTLLQRQQAAIDAMNAANSQLAAIQSLTQKQADAIAALDAATSDRLNAISVATQQGIINLYQALAVWKMARRDRAVSNKIAKLAGSPCSYEPAAVQFSLNNSNSVEDNTARDRTLGMNNRVLAGLMLHTWRSQDEQCAHSRFSQIQSTCAGQQDISPYGVDSVFKLGSINFNPDLYDPNGAMVTQIYNCSALTNPTYDIIEPATKLKVNAQPYCAELFNPRNTPYAFWHLPLANLPDGYPVFFVINLSQVGAQTWLSWVQEGLLLDDRTRGLTARLVTYNAELKVFADIQVAFDFQAGGSIQVSNRIYTLSLELYDPTSANLARYAFEVLLAGCIVLLNLIELARFAQAARYSWRGRIDKGLGQYLSSIGVWLRLANNVLLLAGLGLWWTFVNSHAKQFNMDLRYPVYENLQPQAFFLKLAGNGAGLATAWEAITRLEAAISVLNVYYAINGICILLLIARLLRAMDFQPRLGVVTKALALAAPDLLHFFLVAGSVFLCYCMMGFLIFGNSLPWFATFPTSINTCFEMLLGEFADVNRDLRSLGGLQSVAGILFFWSFELLVFLILLNFPAAVSAKPT